MTMQKTGEGTAESRRVLRIGGSYYLNLPPSFLAANGICPGDLVTITTNSELVVRPTKRLAAPAPEPED